MSLQWGEAAGRRFKICTGDKSQSVNVCFAGPGIDGLYEHRFKTFGTDRLTAYDLEVAAFDTIERLKEFLLQRRYNDLSGQIIARRQWSPLEPDKAWGQQIRGEIDKAVEQLVASFLQNPYRHRVEHSLHCELFDLLDSVLAIGNGRIAIQGDHQTGLVHKEWPEAAVREDQTGRGNFDLAVLSPMKDGTEIEEERFLRGYVKPYAAFELGLDYDRDHFLSDVKKLHHSKIEAGYVIHFARSHAFDQEQVQECLQRLISDRHEGRDGWPTVVMVIFDRNSGQPFVKRIPTIA